MTDWNKIEEEYKTTKLSMKSLAEKHGVKASTLRSRKNREGWTKENETSQRNKAKNNATQRKSVATQKAIEQLNDNDQLTDKQKQFCLLYLKYFNATKAYQEAYGCSYKTAHSNAWQLMANKGIKEELSRLKKAQQKDLYIDSTDIKREWLKQAFADITDFTDFGNEEYTITDEITGEQEDRIRSFVRLKNDDEVDGTLIQEVKVGRDGVSLKLYDKQKALEKIEQFLSETSSVERTVNIYNDISEKVADDDGYIT